ncbi:hypothetical protein EK904_004617 [Melospiza melodia maxima]|nr:hypothetical protein EK904_004617 [Melospiza melodia maxima]
MNGRMLCVKHQITLGNIRHLKCCGKNFSWKHILKAVNSADACKHRSHIAKGLKDRTSKPSLSISDRELRRFRMAAPFMLQHSTKTAPQDTDYWPAESHWYKAEHLIVRVSAALVQIMFVFHACIYALCLPVIKPQHSSLENIPKREMCLFIPWTLINSPKLVLISMSFNSESFQLTFKSGFPSLYACYVPLAQPLASLPSVLQADSRDELCHPKAGTAGLCLCTLTLTYQSRDRTAQRSTGAYQEPCDSITAWCCLLAGHCSFKSLFSLIVFAQMCTHTYKLSDGLSRSEQVAPHSLWWLLL